MTQNVTFTEGKFLSADGKSNIVYSCWRGEEQPKAALQLVHGMAEHIERYDEFARFMAQNGFVVYGHDHLGHGRTVTANEGTRGYFAESDGYKLLVADVGGMNRVIREENPGLPVVLLGHSMGSMVVRLYADAHSDTIDGLIIMGTVGPNPMASAGLVIAKLIAVLRGKKHHSRMMRKLTFGSYNSRIENAQTDNAWLSRDTDRVSRYLDDPLCGFAFTAAGYIDLLTMIQNISAPEWGGGIRKDLPILIVSGKEDPVGDYGKGVETVYAHLQQKEIESLELVLYDEMRHEILGEIGSDGVFGDLLCWCKAQTEK